MRKTAKREKERGVRALGRNEEDEGESRIRVEERVK